MYNVEKIRANFPILERGVRDKKLVYLYNAATSQKSRQVIEALTDYYEQHSANIHHGVHRLAEEATVAYERAGTVRILPSRAIGASSGRSHR